MPLNYHLITEKQDFEQVIDLEALVWKMSPRETISAHMQRIIVHVGGIILGAFEEKRLVGFVLGVPMQATGRLWSHIAAVHPDYQGQGIGFDLKQRQRTWAIAQGYHTMHWTFDPLLAPNANFNFHLLGARADSYHINFYGDMNDSVNAGLPTDRFQATWDLNGFSKPPSPSNAPFLLESDSKGLPQVQRLDSAESCYFAEIPHDFIALKTAHPKLALEWRFASREVLQGALQQGYQVLDFLRSQDRVYYVLRSLQRPPLSPSPTAKTGGERDF